MTDDNEVMQVLLDRVATGQMSRRRFLISASAAGPVAAVPSLSQVDHAFAAGENAATNQANLDSAYDYIVVGAGAAGTDSEAVVDSDLRVYGLRSLRVADASVMPSIVSAPTMAAAVMIGGRAVELIKASH